MHIATYPSLSKESVTSQINKGEIASKSWSRTTFSERRQVLKSLTKWIIENKQEIAEVCKRDTGKEMLDAALGEILTSLEKLDWLVRYGEYYLKPEKRPWVSSLFHNVGGSRFLS